MEVSRHFQLLQRWVQLEVGFDMLEQQIEGIVKISALYIQIYRGVLQIGDGGIGVAALIVLGMRPLRHNTEP